MKSDAEVTRFPVPNRLPGLSTSAHQALDNRLTSTSSPTTTETTMDIPTITEAMRARMGEDSGLEAVLKFDCGAEGVIVLDGLSEPNRVVNEDIEADCTVSISRADLVSLMTGKLNPMTGYMMGKLRVSGNIKVAMKLQKVLGGD
jgi:putative sterol carrier protein